MSKSGVKILFWDPECGDLAVEGFLERQLEDLVILSEETTRLSEKFPPSVKVSFISPNLLSKPNELYQSLFSFALKDKRFFKMWAFESSSPQSPNLNIVISTWRSICTELESGFGFLEDSLRGLKNIIDNLKIIENSVGVEALRDSAVGHPAIVISTGPSLKKALPWLKEMQDRAVLIAADASLKILLENQITPHLVCTLERDEDGLPFFSSLSRESPIPSKLVYFPVVPRSILEAFPGQRLVAYRNQGIFGFLHAQARHALLTTTHSVAHMCVRVAEVLRTSEIILVGQDLAFDPKNFASHSEGVAFEQWAQSQSLEDLKNKLKRMGEDLVWLPGNKETQVPTSTTYVLFAREFARLAQELKTPMINATDGGMKIPGVEWKSTNQISPLQYSAFNFFELMAEKYHEALKLPAPRVSSKVFQDSIHLCLKKLETFKEHLNSNLSISEILLNRSQLRDEPEFFTWTTNLRGGKALRAESDFSQIPLNDEQKLRDWIQTWIRESEQALSAAQAVVQEQTQK